MLRSVAFLALLLIASSSPQASELTVDEAYKAIPHNRTVFDVHASTLSAAHASSLRRLFDLADRGIVLRVEGLRALRSGSDGDIQTVLSGYRVLTSDLQSLHVPGEISSSQALVLQAIQLHQKYFEARLHDSVPGGKIDLAYAQNPDVRRASQNLNAAYGSLMKSFPGEPAVNRQAFYDYLCALDFL